LINLLAPDGDAAFDALEIFEALLPQEVQRLQRTHPFLPDCIVIFSPEG